MPAEVIAELNDDEINTTDKHVRINESPILQQSAGAGGTVTFQLPDNVNNSFYTLKVFPAGTTDFTNTDVLAVFKIRVNGADANAVDLIVGN